VVCERRRAADSSWQEAETGEEDGRHAEAAPMNTAAQRQHADVDVETPHFTFYRAQICFID
jgi:hypothetical protein